MGNNVEDYGDIELLLGFCGVSAFIIGGLTAIFILVALGCMLGGKRLLVAVFTLLFAITCGAALCIPVVLAMGFAILLNSAPSGLFISGVTLLAFIGLYLVIKYIKGA